MATLDTRVLTSPPGEIACSPLTLATQRYTLPAGTLHSVVDFVKNHLTPPLVLSQTDQGTDQGIADVGVMETTPSTGEVLDYSATVLPSGQIGLRVDAMALAAGYACESSGGGPTILKTHGPVPRATAGTATR